MTVELISVGTELLLGNIVNTNSNYLSKKCAELGYSLYYQVTVGDNEERLSDAVNTALSRSDVIILTGGLGPTQDDMTKEAVAKVLKRDLVMDEASKNHIETYFAYRSCNGAVPVVITKNNWKQALKIDGSTAVENDNGTAPGYIIEAEGKVIILLPGPPFEMISMFNKSIFPYLKAKQSNVFLSKMVKICGIGESKAETEILDLIEKQTNPTIAPYAKSGEVHFRITASATTEQEAEQLIQPIIDELYRRFGNNIYTTAEDETLETVVVKLLIQKKYSLATAESCTGGLLTGCLVNVPGISDILQEGIITYSNEAKIKYLGVKPETLHTFGAVSSQTAEEMVRGVANAANSNTALAITGVAGPDGGTPEKPVGTVYIACYVNGEVVIKKNHFNGTRQKVREQSVTQALDMLRRNLL
ncbi:MAG: competence/damage-inducible protein A [Mobilitalea sp.]